MDQESSFVERKVELAYLAAFYGGVLTEHQKEVLAMYCEEDMSLGEIAGETGVSRQSVYNLLSRTSEKLFHLEEALGMAWRFRMMQEGMEACLHALEGSDIPGATRLLRSLMDDNLGEENTDQGV